MICSRAVLKARPFETFLARQCVTRRHSSVISSPGPAHSTFLEPNWRFEKSPASFGIMAWDGYAPLILPGTRLPHRKRAIFQSVFDYIEEFDLVVCFLPPLRGELRTIAQQKVLGLRKAKRGDVKVTLHMTLKEDLSGVLTAGFRSSQDRLMSEIALSFDGKDAGAYRRDTPPDIVTSEQSLQDHVSAAVDESDQFSASEISAPPRFVPLTRTVPVLKTIPWPGSSLRGPE